MELSNFKKNFFENFLKFSEHLVFNVQRREKLTHGLLKILEKHAKIIDFSQLS